MMDQLKFGVCCSGLVAAASAAASVLYVTTGGGGDGTSWGSPLTVVQAFAQAGDGDQLWLQQGTYALTDTLVNDHAISVYGGFEGNESSVAARVGGDVRSILFGCETAGSCCVSNACSGGVNATVRFDAIAFRHGWTRGLSKTGLSQTELVNCEFSGNGWGPTGGVKVFLQGRGAYVTATERTTALRVSNCVFSNNVDYCVNTLGSSISGGGLYVDNYLDAVVLDTDFIGNGVARSTKTKAPARDCGSYGGGLCVLKTRVAATNCVFVGNRMTSNAGWNPGEAGSAFYLGDEGVANTIEGSVLSHCRFVANEACPYSSSSAGRGGVLGVSSSYNQSVLIDHCTIAYNLAIRSKCAGLLNIGANVTVRNSILYGNIAEAQICEGSEIYASGSSNRTTVEYSLLTGSSTPYVKAVDSGTLTLTNIETGDPLFATSDDEMSERMSTPSFAPYNSNNTTAKLYYKNTAEELAAFVDVHLRSIKGRWNGSAWVNDAELSPALDKADPEEDWSLEPEPNGGRANLGVYGATAEASKNKTSVPVITMANVSFPADDYTRPHVTVSLADDEDAYNATVSFCYGQEKPDGEGTEGWFRIAEISRTAHPGDTIQEASGGVFMPATVKLYWRVVVQAGNARVTAEGETTTPANTPPQWGRGGDESVIHVWAGGQGTCGGTNWLDACATLAQAAALVTETRTNIWVAGLVPTGSKACEVNAPVTMLGGYTAMENSPAERAAGAKSVLDGEKINDGLIVNPLFKPSEYTFAETLIADLVFTNTYCSALAFKTRSNYFVRDCDFRCCGQTEDEVSGAAINIGASRTDTLVTISNCTAVGCYKGVGGGVEDCQKKYCVFAFKTAKQIVMVDCAMINCGMKRSFEPQQAYGRESDCVSGILVTAPTTFERCSFRGNVFTTHKNVPCIIRLTADSGTSSAGSSFANCEFTGNVGQQYSKFGSGVTNSALISIAGAAATDLYTFDSCTFAYNCVEAGVAPIFEAEKGTICVSNTIFWGNRGITNLAQKGYIVASVANMTSANANLSLDYCLNDNWLDLPVACFGAGVSASTVTVSNGLVADPLFQSATDDVLSHVRMYTTLNGESPLCRFYFPGVTGLADAAAYTGSLNVHLRGRSGYTDPLTGELVMARQNSPAIDAGDPTADWSAEPTPNGKRRNLGAWGNTPYATRTFVSPGLLLFIR